MGERGRVVAPLQAPDGMTWEVMLAMPVTEGQWREADPLYVCKGCNNTPHLHPYTNYIWGCRTCNFTTMSPGVFFDNLAEDDQL
jgi:ribosomal protein L37AE/L43A